jgi:hypothetical protein
MSRKRWAGPTRASDDFAARREEVAFVTVGLSKDGGRETRPDRALPRDRDELKQP